MGAVSEKETVHAPAPRRLPVQVVGFDGTLEELVLAAQRGDVDLRELPVAQVTTRSRASSPVPNSVATCAMRPRH
jgi:hypothetical protein